MLRESISTIDTYSITFDKLELEIDYRHIVEMTRYLDNAYDSIDMII